MASTTSTDATVVAQCQNDVNGYCDAFQLQFLKEADGTASTIASRRSAFVALTDTTPAGLSAPGQPAVIGSYINSTQVRFTASSASCTAPGSVEYKIRYNNNSTLPEWSTVSWSATTIVNINPGANTRYYSQSLARCVNGADTSADSAVSNVDLLDFSPPNTAPSVTASASAASTSSIQLSWTATGTPTITYAVSGSGNASSCTSSPCTVTGLAASTPYTFTVTGTNPYGTGSGTTSATTNSPTATCSSVPSAPTVSAFGASTSTISTSWTTSSTPANCSAPTYTVAYGPATYSSTACAGTSSTSCSLSGLASSTTYYIQVTATNSAGSSSGTTSATTNSPPAATCSSAPSAPTVNASATSSSAISTSWTASSTPANCSAPTYTVAYGPSTYNTTGCSNTAATSCGLSGLTSNTTYYIQVTAQNSYGSSSGTTSAKTYATLSISNAAITLYGVLRTDFTYNGAIGSVSGSIACDSIAANGGTSYTCVTQLASCTANRTITLTDSAGASATATATGTSAPSSTPNPSLGTKYANGWSASWPTLPNATYYKMRVYLVGGDGSPLRSVDDTQPSTTVSSLAAGGRQYRMAVWGSNCAGDSAQGSMTVTLP